MFVVAQLIGIYVANAYQPDIVPGTNQTIYNIPYGFEPPQDISPQTTTFSIVIALAIAVSLMLLLMKLKAETFLRLWFFVVVIIGLAIAINAFLIDFQYSSWIALAIAIPLAILKIFKRDIIAHNFTEILIYPGIATVFIPLLNIWATVALLLVISAYDMYAVWHAGFMQKMAKYQIEKVRVFSGFFVPYLNKKDRIALKKAKALQKKGKKVKGKKVAVNVAILGGGDVVFPIILAGVVLPIYGIFGSLIIAAGASIALALLFLRSEKGKAYPAMPFITAGCLVALGIVYLLL